MTHGQTRAEVNSDPLGRGGTGSASTHAKEVSQGVGFALLSRSFKGNTLKYFEVNSIPSCGYPIFVAEKIWGFCHIGLGNLVRFRRWQSPTMGFERRVTASGLMREFPKDESGPRFVHSCEDWFGPDI